MIFDYIFHIYPGIQDDHHVKVMMAGSTLRKVKSRSWKKQRHFRLLDDGLTVWYKSRWAGRGHSTCRSFTRLKHTAEVARTIWQWLRLISSDQCSNHWQDIGKANQSNAISHVVDMQQTDRLLVDRQTGSGEADTKCGNFVQLSTFPDTGIDFQMENKNGNNQSITNPFLHQTECPVTSFFCLVQHGWCSSWFRSYNVEASSSCSGQ